MKWVSFIFYSIGLVGICFAGNEAKQTVLWERKLPFYRLYYSVNKSDTVAYFTTNGNIVEALDLKTGKPLWIVTYSETVSSEGRSSTAKLCFSGINTAAIIRWISRLGKKISRFYGIDEGLRRIANVLMVGSPSIPPSSFQGFLTAEGESNAC
jgi:hypothetical protein